MRCELAAVKTNRAIPAVIRRRRVLDARREHAVPASQKRHVMRSRRRRVPDSRNVPPPAPHAVNIDEAPKAEKLRSVNER